MPDQETLPGTGRIPFDPLDHGLYRHLVDSDGVIVHGAWLRACAAGEFVGTCRQCGDYLIPARPDEVTSQRIDYEAACRRRQTITVVDGVRRLDGCGWRLIAAGGRTFTRSSRRSERRGRR